MARPLRIEYPNAWYHVMNRGRRSETVFSNKRDYQCFIELLQETIETWGIRIAAYCLMPNHYHLLIQTPQANLSRSMRHLNGVYTQRYNRRHQCDGQVFRGRYKSILIEEDTYLLHLLRYIHKNPVKAKLAVKPDNYPWSSHKAYVSDSRAWSWIYKHFLLSMLTPDKNAQVKAYKKFMAEAEDPVSEIIESEKWPSFLGSESFGEWIKGRFHQPEAHAEIPQARELAPDMDRIVEAVSAFYHVDEARIYSARRGTFNEPRNVAVYLARKLRGDTLARICDNFSINNYSSASSIIGRIESRIQQDSRLRKNIEHIKIQLYMSQTKT